MMKLSDLISDLKRDEGVRLVPYDDATGLPLKQGDTIKGKITIGVGRNLTDRGITDAESDILVKADAEIAIEDLDRNVPYWREWPDNVQRAVANMCMNMGWTKLKYFVLMWAALEADDWDAAAAEALDSKWARQVGDRATRIADLMRLG